MPCRLVKSIELTEDECLFGRNTVPFLLVPSTELTVTTHFLHFTAHETLEVEKKDYQRCWYICTKNIHHYIFTQIS
jgi:hypothetical protein